MNQSEHSGKPSDEQLDERLRQLGDRLGKFDAVEKTGKAKEGQGADPAGLSKAMRLSSEFIAGVIAGGLLGFVCDRVFGTSPWGMILFVMLGFGAGLMNLMRASGSLGPPPGAT